MIGGGTGSFTLLSSLKNYVQDITAIVNMADNGGSTGVLRDELGVLPPGDVRQCLVALSRSSRDMRKLFNYRFEEGTFAGHAFGNLFLAALEKTTGSFARGLRTAAEILNIQGKVVPVALGNVHLALKQGQRLIEGETTITQLDFKNGRPKLFLRPPAALNPEAAAAIAEAQLVVIAPGDLYSSIVPTLLVKGMDRALRTSPAKIIYVCNLVTKPGQTDNFAVHDFGAEIEKYIGASSLDAVIYNDQEPPGKILDKYAKAGEHWVKFDLVQLEQADYQAYGESLVSRRTTKANPADKLLERSLIRHDGDKIARLLMRLYFS